MIFFFFKTFSLFFWHVIFQTEKEWNFLKLDIRKLCRQKFATESETWKQIGFSLIKKGDIVKQDYIL